MELQIPNIRRRNFKLRLAVTPFYTQKRETVGFLQDDRGLY